MRILLLIIQFPPDVNTSGRLMAQVGEGLIAHGHAVSVLTALPHYEKFRIWDEYRGRLVCHAEYKGMDVLRLWVYASGTKQRMLHRLASYLSFNALAMTFGLLLRREFDLILCPNGSFFTGLAAQAIGAPRGIPFVYNVQDLYPEVPVAAGQLHNRHAIRGLELLEGQMYRASRHITVITPSFRQNLIAKGVPANKISVIPNFVDIDFIRPLPRDNPFSQQYGLQDKFVVTHSGNLGYVYDLETLLEAAARLRSVPAMVFLIIGDGVARPALQQKAEALGLKNVRFLPFQPHAMLPYLRAASDVQVSLYRRGSATYSMPSKIYEIMASGRPLLVSADPASDAWSLVEQSGCGVCVEPHDPDQLADALLALYHDPALRQVMAQNGRSLAEQRYSKQVVVDCYDDLFQQIVGPSQSIDAACSKEHIL